MDPISLGISAVGFGLSLFGSKKKAEAADPTALNAATQEYAQWQASIAQKSGDIARQEQNINNLKMQQMELQGRRSQLENVRNMQRSRAMATNAAVNQGAQGGTGLFGGLAQIENQGLFNMQGLSNSLQTGRAVNNFNNAISNDKLDIATYQANAALAQGKMQIASNNMQAKQASANSITSLGGALLGNAGTIGNLSKNVFGSSSGGFGAGSLFFGGGTPSGL